MRPFNSKLYRSFLTLAVLLAVRSSVSGQEETTAPQLRPSWECLPDDTTLATRMPNGKAFLDALRDTTKLGAVVFSEDRVRRFQELVSAEESWEKVREKLGQYGLFPNDLLQFFAGETGFAVVLDGRGAGGGGQSERSWIGLGWLTPGRDLAQRLLVAVEHEVEKREDEDPPVKRIDIEIDGHPVMLLTVPQVQEIYDKDAYELPDNFSELSAEERREALRRANEAAESKKETKIQYAHVLVAALEGRVLLGVVLNPAEEQGSKRQADRLTAVFGQFFAAHRGEPGSFVSRVASVRGVREALPQDGVVLLELLADSRPFLSLVKESGPGEAEDRARMRARVVQALGGDRLGVAALRISLLNSVLRTGMFLEAPAPRSGLVSVLDQPTLAPEPARWVPASVVEYGHLSLDLGRLYSQIKELVIREVGDIAESQFQKVEAGVNGVAGADLAAVLSSLGHQHTILSFEPKLQEADALDGEEKATTVDRTAIVWKVKDEAIWNRIIQAAQSFTALAQGTVKYGEEQGFNGYRMTTESMEGGLFLGKGYLVLAFGEGVVEQTLSMLNNPPAGKDALLNSDVYARATDLLPLKPGLSFQVTDGDRYARFMRQVLDKFFRQPMMFDGADFDSEDVPQLEDVADVLERLGRLIPTEDEFQNVFGVGVSYMRATEDGLEIKSASELPAP